ncbi:MAG TPA: hypothetical protein VEK73_02180 [Xanthobacteraceae bacterium]|nr:hypothetical protein [Xanthobacteraceae bacterium]
MRIGVDFDNTLVFYDRAFATVGQETGLLPADFTGGKDAAKRLLCRARPDGYLWERLQGLVYGRRIDQAQLYAGAAEFLRRCRDLGDWQVYVISHKTVLAHHDPLQTNLRDSALGWMTRQGFFDERGFGLDPGRVFFEDTRDAKVRRIGVLDCRIFVDDLPEVLGHADMPAACRKILFGAKQNGAFECAADWTEVSAAVFQGL